MGDTELPESIYDVKETPEDQLWFLPPPPEDVAPTDPPWTIADREISAARTWVKAEREHAVPLARAAAAFGALNDRLKQMGQGARHRIALAQVAGFCWQLEGGLSAEQIALYLAARISRAGDNAPAMARAAWAMRRLLDPRKMRTGGLAEFLGRGSVADDEIQRHINRPQGEEFAALETLFWAQLSELHASHPITRAAFSWHLWQQMGLSGETAWIEGAVVAAKIGARTMVGQHNRRSAGFLPLAIAQNHGTASARLKRFYAGVDNECLAALLTLDRVAAWQERATQITGHLSGRTQARIIEALALVDAVSRGAGDANQRIPGGRAEEPRSILVREVTGQGRFRIWAAKG